MVQRKVSEKLRVLPDHVKSEKRMANLKPSSQHQESKNKAACFKIKMKKSKSMKLSELNSPRSSATKRISLPGKPPPGDIPRVIASPRKQSPSRAMEQSPNYMKSTSSADARRGSSLVSSRDSHSVSDSKHIKKSDSSSSKVSPNGSKLTKTVSKTLSMKLIRSLTKTASFKNARSTAKCSRVATSADINVHKTTCSSTMKDSKFPQYLVLNSGGTQLKGTSIEKVCHYSYCSLNGHHHSPVPPLKLFLSTRRRSLKTQRSFKVEALSPHRAKRPVFDKSRKVEDSPLCKEQLSCSKSISMREEEKDYLIKNYASNKNDSGANKDSQDANDKGNFSFAAEPEDSNCIPYWGANVKQVVESLSDGPPCSEVDFEGTHEQYGGIIPAGTEIAENYPDAEKDFQFNLVQEELDPKRLVYDVNPERENHEVIKAPDTNSEATDIDWEDVHLFSEADYFIKLDFEPHWELEPNGKAETKANDTKVTFHEEIKCNEIVEYISEGESGRSDEQLVDHYPEVPDRDVNNQDVEAGSLKYEPVSPDEETNEDFSVTGEKEKLAESMGVVSSSMSLTEDPTVEGMADDRNGESRITEAENFKFGPQQGDNQIEFSSEAIVEAPSNQEENNQNPDAVIMSTKENFEIDEDGGGEKSEQDEDVADFGLQLELLHACGHQVAENEQVADADQSDGEVDKTASPCQIITNTENGDLAKAAVDVHNESTALEMCIENFEGESTKSKISNSTTSQEQDDPEFNISSSSKDCANAIEKMEKDDDLRTDSSEITSGAESTTRTGFEGTTLYPGVKSNEKVLDSCNNLIWIIQRKGATEDEEEPSQFNPREPNYLPLVPDPEAEMVNLQHQDVDEKNSEDWMLDHALQKAVNKLAPARKRKVALLVEAFETVATK